MNEREKMKGTEGAKSTVRQAPEFLFVLARPRCLCLAGLLAAMSFILGKFLQVPNPFSNFVRISFENLPLVLAGLALGPVAGAMTGAVADLVGCLLYGYDINPIVTLGAAAVGFFAGLASYLPSRVPTVWRVIFAEVTAHVAGSLFLKTWGLAQWYLAQYNMGYWQMFGWRAGTYLMIATLETLILTMLLRHKGFSQQLRRLCKG